MKISKIQIFVTGCFLILFVKFYLRPYIQLPLFFNLLKDVAPNLISAFLIPFGADLCISKWAQLIDKKMIFWASCIGFVLITLNELAQLMPIFKRTFDYYDIFFSLIGTFLGYKVYMRWFFDNSVSEKKPLYH